jgi:hypothetical protein
MGKTVSVETEKLGVTERVSLVGANSAFKSAKDCVDECRD